MPQFENHLPNEYATLIEVIDVLPGTSHSLFDPMASLVININARTNAHRDAYDMELCLVMPIGDFNGGELVMVEQGLVFPLQNGDIAVFRSAETTHFNMDYTGCRCSFVLQTDREFDKWINYCNGWSSNMFFN